MGALDDSLLPHVGASRRLDSTGAFVNNRDAVDTRQINDYRNGTGIHLTSGGNGEAQVGGYPVLAPGTLYADTDRDGMADAWENARFGSLSRDGKLDYDSDGFTDVEEFLNGTNPKDGTTGVHRGRVGRHGDVKRTQPITPVYNLQGRKGVKRVGGYGEEGGCGVRVFGDGVVVRMNR